MSSGLDKALNIIKSALLTHPRIGKMVCALARHSFLCNDIMLEGNAFGSKVNRCDMIAALTSE